MELLHLLSRAIGLGMAVFAITFIAFAFSDKHSTENGAKSAFRISLFMGIMAFFAVLS